MKRIIHPAFHMLVDTISIVILASFVFLAHVEHVWFGFVVNHTRVEQLSIKGKTLKHDI